MAQYLRAPFNILQKERKELMVKEEELSHNVKLLQSKLENEQNQRQTLEEKIKIVST